MHRVETHSIDALQQVCRMFTVLKCDGCLRFKLIWVLILLTPSHFNLVGEPFEVSLS